MLIRIHRTSYGYTFMRFWFVSSPRCCCSLPRVPEKGNLPKKYDPKFVEAGWHDFWSQCLVSQRKVSHPSTSHDSNPFAMCLPPPNITGNLHLGHALTVVIEDVFVRWNRMKGRPTVWIPGFDHAGIATQLVVRRYLEKTKNVDIMINATREGFIKYCNEWKEQKVGEIKHQLNRLGASLDWDQAYYTLDERFSKAVQAAFVQLYNRGLITRQERLVNWSPYLKSTISDFEVENLKISGPTRISVPGSDVPARFGELHFIRYPGFGGNQHGIMIVATSRPETIFADTAIAVHPTDDRYANQIGYNVWDPFRKSCLKIIPDASVDPEYGSGAVKITPGHSSADYGVACRHNLPIISCLDEDGKLRNVAHKLCGMSRFEAREKVITEIKQLGLYKKCQPIEQVIPTCGRSGDIIEPMMKSQWFLDLTSCVPELAKLLGRDSPQDPHRLDILPPNMRSVWLNWLKGSRHWCLSRQIWWGHQIPAYRIWPRGTAKAETAKWYVAESNEEAMSQAVRDFCVSGQTDLYCEQDRDVFDTWFSSALIPLILAGWPNNATAIMADGSVPPLSLMETGQDILSFWVNNMAILGLLLINKVPFDKVLMHGIIRDSQGRKMSKSLGNVIDPIDALDGRTLKGMQERLKRSALDEDEVGKAMEGLEQEFPKGIAGHGADALRFCLLYRNVQQDTINFSVDDLGAAARFCNKIWQSFHLGMNIIAQSQRDYVPIDQVASGSLTATDRWILSKAATTAQDVSDQLEKYSLSGACDALVTFWWYNVCDYYLEYAKRSYGNPERLSVSGSVIIEAMDIFFRSMAPFMPYLSEELYHRLPGRPGDSSIHQVLYPSQCDDVRRWINRDIEDTAKLAVKIIKSSRDIKHFMDLLVKDMVTGHLVDTGARSNRLLGFEDFMAAKFAGGFQELHFYNSIGEDQAGMLPIPITNEITLYLDLQDIDLISLLEKFAEKAQTLRGQILKLQERKQKLEDMASDGARLTERHRRLLRSAAKDIPIKTGMLEILRLRFNAVRELCDVGAVTHILWEEHIDSSQSDSTKTVTANEETRLTAIDKNTRA